MASSRKTSPDLPPRTFGRRCRCLARLSEYLRPELDTHTYRESGWRENDRADVPPCGGNRTFSPSSYEKVADPSDSPRRQDAPRKCWRRRLPIREYSELDHSQGEPGSGQSAVEQHGTTHR